MKVSKIRRIKPYTQKWYREATRLAVNCCPPIHPCSDCGYPVIKGYCCGYCGSETPNEKKDESQQV